MSILILNSILILILIFFLLSILILISIRYWSQFWSWSQFSDWYQFWSWSQFDLDLNFDLDLKHEFWKFWILLTDKQPEGQGRFFISRRSSSFFGMVGMLWYALVWIGMGCCGMVPNIFLNSILFGPIHLADYNISKLALSLA